MSSENGHPRPYGSQALRYLTHGWASPLPAGNAPRQKSPVPAGFTGRDGRLPDEDQIAEWVRNLPERNIGLRAPDGAVGLDVDAYKDGSAETMKAISEAHGQLPRTWVSTSKTDLSGIRWFANPRKLEFDGVIKHPTDDSLTAGEVIQPHHRYGIVWPSIHPTGDPYFWLDQTTGERHDDGTIPKVDDLPDLPDPWADHLAGICSCFAGRYDWSKVKVASGDPVADSFNRWHSKLVSGTYARHDAALGGTLALAGFRYRGWPGAAEYLAKLEDAFLAAVTSDKSRTPAKARAEWESMVEGAEAKAPSSLTSQWEPSRRPANPAGTTGSEPWMPDETDTSNADRLVQLHGDHTRYIDKWDTWIVWADHHWEEDPKTARLTELAKDVGKQIITEALDIDGEAARKAAIKWGSQTLGAPRIRAMIELARGVEGNLIDHEILDTNPWLLGVADGVIDLRTGQHRPGDPSNMMTLRAPVHWDPEARSPLWEKCLERWQPDPEMRAFIQRIAGAAATGHPSEVLLINVGTGANGKSKFYGGLADTLGPYATVVHKSLLLAKKYDEHDTVKSNLFRRRLAIASESNAGAILDDEKVKSLTGGDRISGRRMRENPWEFNPSHLLVIYSNHRPVIQGVDEAVWRRIHLIPWQVTIPTSERDEHLAKKLRDERGGILPWIVEGARQFHQQGLNPPEQVLEASRSYRHEQDTVERFIREEGVTFHPNASTTAVVLVDRHSNWCQENSLDPASHWQKVTEKFRERGATPGRTGSRGRFWQGVTIGFKDTE